MRRYSVYIQCAICALILAGCGAKQADTTEAVLSTEKVISAQSDTEAQNVAEIESCDATGASIAVTVAPKEIRELKKAKVEEKTTEKTTEKATEAPKKSAGAVPSGGHLTRSGGVYYYNGRKETWYSTNEACGQTTAVPIPGKHADENGIIRDADGYVCVASSDHAIYSIVETSWGAAKVYDTGCSHGTIDIYTSW